MLTKSAMLAVLLAAPVIATSQSKLTGKKLETSQLPLAAQVAKQGEKLTGPVGYGPVKLGMSKAEIEALKQDDGVFLSSPLSPNQDKSVRLEEKQELYDALLVTQLSPGALKSMMRFEDDKLSSLTIHLDEFSFEKVRKQISEKYGPGETEDNRKEEQCIYRNGANFKIKSGGIFTIWKQSKPNVDQVLTSLVDMDFNACSGNLRYAPVNIIKTKILTIMKKPAPIPEKKNLF